MRSGKAFEDRESWCLNKPSEVRALSPVLLVPQFELSGKVWPLRRTWTSRAFHGGKPPQISGVKASHHTGPYSERDSCRRRPELEATPCARSSDHWNCAEMLQKPCRSADDIPSQSAEDGANVRKLLAPIHRTGVALRSGDSIPPTTALFFFYILWICRARAARHPQIGLLTARLRPRPPASTDYSRMIMCGTEMNEVVDLQSTRS